MSRFEDYSGYQLERGDNHRHESLCLSLLDTLGRLQPGMVADYVYANSADEEQEGLRFDDVGSSSGSFERTRSEVRQELRLILKRVVEEYDIPVEGGMDLGAGASGEMVEELLPLDVSTRSSWQQLELNPGSVRMNKKRHPDSVIVEGSYLDLSHVLGDRKLNVMTGLSSFDATHFMERAVWQVRDHLEPGGVFLHMQDVRPGIGPALQELQMSGQGLPILAVRVSGSANDSDVIGYHTDREGFVSSGELFRRRLSRAIRSTGGMELLCDEWVTARRLVPDASRPAKLYYMNTLLNVHSSVIPFDATTAVVTVARKV